MKRLLAVFVMAGLIAAIPVTAQQSGSIQGRVTDDDGSALPGVTVEARGDVLPRARVTTTNEQGRYSLPALPPGEYELTFTLAGMATATRQLRVLLQQESAVNVNLRPEEFGEEIVVLGESSLVDTSSAEIKNVVSSEQFNLLPVGQEYRELVKLAPGIQYTEDSIRGPSAGGSGQDNAYQFDGVSVTLPLFGTLSTEPSFHDVDQFAIVRGGADAVDFNRSGGATFNTISKSGTNRFQGELRYQLQSESMTGSRDLQTLSEFDEDKDWLVANIGGPAIRDNLYFFSSYYRPTVSRSNQANVYGSVPDLDDTRDEFFGKLTWTPTGGLLLHGSYRDSDRDRRGTGTGVGGSFSPLFAGSTSSGEDATLKIAILEGSWVPTGNSLVSAKYTDFRNETRGRPDRLLGFPIAIDGSVGLDVNNLDQMGRFQVPEPIGGDNAFNAFIQPLIDRHGFPLGGVQQGGGFVGVGHEINNQDFLRESYQAGYDYMVGWGAVTHELHVGYQWFEDSEDLLRTSNGWGRITVPGGRNCIEADGTVMNNLRLCDDVGPDGTPVFYTALFQQMSLGENVIPGIRSDFESQSIELNDVIRWNDWTFNVGVLLSNDTYWGQGLRREPNNPLTGFAASPGTRYKMHEIDFDDMVQPRLGAVWAYNGRDTVFANYARYHPTVSSLPRAASWDRNLAAEIQAHFDADGNFLGSRALAASSGKLFVDGIRPRLVDEYMIGTSRQLASRWTARATARHRDATRFWEDTGNNDRISGDAPAPIPQAPYIPDLTDRLAEIGSGSTYVIAELDGAFTKYYEVALETDWRGQKTSVTGSYVWSQYYGNFDQDSTTTDNDLNIFFGSSNFADGPGRQVWDFRDGRLRGDRRHVLKVFGVHQLDWNASAGAFAVFQSGQPWEAWSFRPYTDLTGSTSNVARLAEPAGSRTTSDHYQVDLNYTQNFPFAGRYNVQVALDVFNVFDKQTGYDISNQGFAPGIDDEPPATFGIPRRAFAPRRLQAAVRFQF